MAAFVVLTPAELSANEDLPLSSLWGKRRTSRASAKASASAASAKPPVKASAPAAPAKPRRQRNASVSAVSAKPPVPTSSPSRKGKTETLDLVPVTQAAEDEDRSVRKVNKTLKLADALATVKLSISMPTAATHNMQRRRWNEHTSADGPFTKSREPSAKSSATPPVPTASPSRKARTETLELVAVPTVSAKPPVPTSAPSLVPVPTVSAKRPVPTSAPSAKRPVPTSSPSLVPVTQAAEDEDRSVRIVRKVNKTLKLSEDQVALYKYFRRTYKGKRGRADLVHECRATGVSSRASRKTMCKRLAKNMSD